MKPKFMQHIHIDIPKDLTPEFDELGNMTISAINQMIVQQVESIDDKICKEICDMAISNGIDDVYLLDKKQILSALEKQIPKKRADGWYGKNTECPICHIVASNKYCSNCGQALDWSDTE